MTLQGTSTAQAVVQGQNDSLWLRVSDSVSQEPVTLSGVHTITIYQPGGQELIAATSVGITASENVVKYTRDWLEAAGFSRAQHYRARWSLNNGTIERDMYFSVVRRKFISTLDQEDFTTQHAYLLAQLPSGVSNFAPYLQSAWERISSKIRQKMGLYPGDVFYPDQFSECHKYWTLAAFFFANAFDGNQGSEDRWKYETCEKRGHEELSAAMARVTVDMDDDGVVDNYRDQRFASGIPILR